MYRIEQLSPATGGPYVKLYYSPFACSLATHIACREAGLEVELIRVELSTKRTAKGGDLFTENPMGQVPTLVLDGGRILTENVAILAYLGEPPRDAAAGGGEAPDRYELMRWLSFVATEVHKKILWPIYAPGSPDAVKDYARGSAARAFGVLGAHLEARDTLVGDGFTTADAYLFWALTLMPHAGVSLEQFPALQRYHERNRARPAVRAVLRYEREQLETPFAA
jgi:glutathione S-transferase